MIGWFAPGVFVTLIASLVRMVGIVDQFSMMTNFKPVSHRSVGKLLGGALLGLSAGYFWSFYLDNAGYSVFTCNDGKFTLVRWNEACHLGERTVERY